MNSLHGATGDEGPLHTSKVTGLARLPGRTLLFVDMGNFGPVDRVAIKLKHNLNGGPCKLVSFTVFKSSFVYS